ncbi:ATP-dependent DNA helicase RecG [Acidimicrobiia bacterium]|nr:ATP-dependent DNA helicase RecG [Candidatus Actinomarina sp.]MDA9844619.1 ATP-dependent DNA helicase RecG [Acidimicrobiia bacterium]MDB3969512.1 ATP-dependent DNA helicase RecG [Acidimicrobiia bacterium]MDB3984276.1 ATP-dependent DNA helicase RecG [Acidimicrobiia bacterium]MDB4814210.1 ATP-dependent DNA helicase RecG [Acidimicrobiia bacterium]
MVKRDINYLSNIDISEIKGFGEKRIKSLNKSGIKSIVDLIRFYPRKHIDRSDILTIEDVRNLFEFKEITVLVKIAKVSVFTTRSRLRIATLLVSDETGDAKAKWFGPQYIETRFKEGDTVAISGVPDVKKTGSVEFKNATIEKYLEFDELNETGALIPIYKKIEGLSSTLIRKGIKHALKRTPEIEDYINDEQLTDYELLDRTTSLNDIHFPEGLSNYYKAKKRLAFDEFIYLQTIFKRKKKSNKLITGSEKIQSNNELMEAFTENLDFELTSAQKRTINEILIDMNKNSPMKRLLQGDVGSGKTIVAACAVYSASNAGFKSALMAPTEVLAEQHYNSLNPILDKHNIKTYLLTSSVKDRSEIINQMSSAEPVFFIGTHALIQENVVFNNLGLAIIDEQQRFGVDQRKKLIESSNIIPHQIVMTATPIPRTTALAVYGDLDISIIDELPPGREEIENILLSGLESDNNQVVDYCKQHLLDNSQIFVVCPYIDESENKDIKAAENVYEQYINLFPDSNVKILHGRMKSEEKELIMSQMNKGQIDILVSTVVIEVGIDIANATLMIIESAERFGLNQLHQLRGRVGRGSKKSQCIFHISNKLTIDTITDVGKQRLSAIVSTNDGFKLSEMDLQIRGEGKVTGTDQSGLSDLKIADLRYDFEILNLSKLFFNKEITPELEERLYLEATLLFPNFMKVEDTT